MIHVSRLASHHPWKTGGDFPNGDRLNCRRTLTTPNPAGVQIRLHSFFNVQAYAPPPARIPVVVIRGVVFSLEIALRLLNWRR